MPIDLGDLLPGDVQELAALSAAMRPKSGQRCPDANGGLIAAACHAAVDRRLLLIREIRKPVVTGYSVD
jgi:hypothetical protein